MAVINKNFDAFPHPELGDINFIFKSWMHNSEHNGFLNRIDQLAQEAMLTANEQDDRSHVWEYEKDLANLAARQDLLPQAHAEISAACALVDFRFCRFDQAAQHLGDAIRGFLPYLHYVTMARWMQGIAFWHSRGLELEAFHNWITCHDEISQLALDRNQGEGLRKWYVDRQNEIQEFLDLVEEKLKTSYNDGPSEAKAIGGSESEPEGSQAPASSLLNETGNPEMAAIQAEEFIPADYLRLFSIVGEIPAGEPGQAAFHDDESETIMVDRLIINDVYYRVEMINEDMHVGNLTAGFPAALKVRGQSMNQIPLLPGDYVLVNRELGPKHGDVVCAYIENDNFDESMTLKKYVQVGNRFVLRASSDDPEFENWPGIPDEELSYSIRGVVIARLVQA